MSSLNPFGTGQCLTTHLNNLKFYSAELSIPLEQGNVLRLCRINYFQIGGNSQSLWNRAMSYDKITSAVFPEGLVSQSLWNRAMSYDQIKEAR